MKIGIFTDSHYSSRELSCGCRYNSRSLRKIGEAYELFDREGCALAICLGDLIDTEGDRAKELENLGAVAEIMGKSNTPTACPMGIRCWRRYCPRATCREYTRGIITRVTARATAVWNF